MRGVRREGSSTLRLCGGQVPATFCQGFAENTLTSPRYTHPAVGSLHRVSWPYSLSGSIPTGTNTRAITIVASPVEWMSSTRIQRGACDSSESWRYLGTFRAPTYESGERASVDLADVNVAIGKWFSPADPETRESEGDRDGPDRPFPLRRAVRSGGEPVSMARMVSGVQIAVKTKIARAGRRAAPSA